MTAPDRPNLITLTGEQVGFQIAELTADRAEWTRLQDRYGSLKGLQTVLDQYEWLLGGDPA